MNQYRKNYRKRKRSRRKTVPMGKGISSYRLYVKFLPVFQNPRIEHNYYSRDSPDYRAGLRGLEKRVLNGTCRGRYSIAMLYEELTNQCLRVYLPDEQPLSYWEYQKHRRNFFEKPLLKAQVKFQRPYIEKLISKGKRYSRVLKSSDNRDKAVALQDLKNQLSEEPFRSNLRWADVYDQSDNKLVVRINFGGGVERLDEKFKNVNS